MTNEPQYESLNLYGTKEAVEQAIAEIRKTARIHSRAEWRPSEAELGPGFAVIVISCHYRLDVDIAADAAGVKVQR